MPNQPAATNTTATQHVFITVAGGVAYVASAPETVKIHVIDYDNLEADFDSTFSQFTIEERAFYWQTHNAAISSAKGA